MKKLLGITLGVLLASVVLLPTLAIILFEIPPVRPSKLKQVQVGMSKEQVKNILGKPSLDHGGIWTYSGIGWNMVHIMYDETGKVREVVKDD